MFKLPWNSTIASFVAKDSNLLGAVTNGWPVYSEIAFAIASSNPLYAFKPVPTAVPPWANSESWVILLYTLLIAIFNWWAYPENYCPKVIGVASWVWVLPILIMLANYLD